jgi:uncharacterized protein YjiS (DUF1127 family)
MKASFGAPGSPFRRILAPRLGILRPVGNAIGSFVAGTWRRYQQSRRLYSTAAQLHAMDDRDLKDIGLCRCEIEFVLSGIADPTRQPRTLAAAAVKR